MSSTTILCSSDFHHFSLLPLELQLKIWQQAVPDPYSIPSAIVMIVNPDVDLAHPRAFLPSAKQLLKIEEDTIDDISGDRHHGCRHELVLRQPVFSMLQTCRASRAITQETYILDLSSTIQEGSKALLKDSEDMIYFHILPQTPDYLRAGFRYLTFVEYLVDNHVTCHQFNDLKHIAFQLDELFLEAINDSEFFSKDDEALKPLLDNFKALESISIFIHDFLLGSDWWDQRFVLYPPDNEIRIRELGMTTDEIRNDIERGFLYDNDHWDVPIIDMYVVFRMKNKQVR